MPENNFTDEKLQHYLFRTEKPDYTVPEREPRPEPAVLSPHEPRPEPTVLSPDKPRSEPVDLFPADPRTGLSRRPPPSHEKSEETIRRNQLIEEIKNLTPKAIEALEEMISNSRIQAMARVKAIELALSYALGKPETPFRLEAAGGERVIEASERIERIVRNIRIAPPDSPPANPPSSPSAIPQEGSSGHAG